MNASELLFVGIKKSLSKLKSSKNGIDLSGVPKMTLRKGEHTGVCMLCGCHTEHGFLISAAKLTKKNGLSSNPLKSIAGSRTSFTDWPDTMNIPAIDKKDTLDNVGEGYKALLNKMDMPRVVSCPHCTLMGRNVDINTGNKVTVEKKVKGKMVKEVVHETEESFSIGSSLNGRIGSSLISESGQAFYLGSQKRLKWMLLNMHLVKPPFVMSNIGNETNFKHKAWKSKISLSIKAFYINTSDGNTFVRMSHILEPNDHSTSVERHLNRLVTNDANDYKPEKAGHPFLFEFEL